VFDDADRLAEAAAADIESWLRLQGPEVTIGLAGGSTPQATYARLAEVHLPWKQVHGWMTDERHVPADHPDSNAGMVRRSLFDRVPATLHEVPWFEDPVAAAAAYEEELDALLERTPAGLRPGLVILGVGTDGHTASLFPGDEALEVGGREFVASFVESRDAWRMTATIDLLTRARRTVFLVSGAHKAEVVAEILEGETDCPAAVVSERSRDAVWLLDRDAAGRLSG
jgi:6-phosphogluconolactonase